MGGNGGSDDLTAKEACCTCGGGCRNGKCPTATCRDVEGWKNPMGPPTCDMYTASNGYCRNFGSKVDPNTGKNAKEACCACGGGLKPTTAPTPAPTPEEEGEEEPTPAPTNEEEEEEEETSPRRACRISCTNTFWASHYACRKKDAF